MRWECRLSLNDPMSRLLLAAAVAGLVVTAIWLVRLRDGRSTVRVMPADLGPFPIAMYFGDDTCASCKPASVAIALGGLEVRTYQWAENGDVFDLLEIAQIPRLVVVGRRGQVMADISGVPTPKQIARAKLQLSRE